MKALIFTPRFNWFDLFWISTSAVVAKESIGLALLITIVAAAISGFMERSVA
ncbi:hypothetical protein M527_06555 [Sphingobium indicum IP26]|uniref:hypothetical protein n=1 Tax=Sphingobium indicum TaxID=332055 RepID=UPI00037ED184|nr:hypothetical protein [Sphingobium indicum]EPR09784.1 hypothetical protein M527_06555 [Sphingobium indicum IP26]